MAQEDALAKGTDIAGRRRREALHTDRPVWRGCGAVPVDGGRSVQSWETQERCVQNLSTKEPLTHQEPNDSFLKTQF